LAVHLEDVERSERVDVLLTQMTNSTGAIYPAPFLLEQLLTSVRGKYPEFRQIDIGREKFADLAARRGYYLESSKDRLGDKGALLLVSGVTGKSRLVLAVYGLGGPVPMFTTFDYKDNRIRPDEQFIRNLVLFEGLFDATEAFIPMS